MYDLYNVAFPYFLSVLLNGLGLGLSDRAVKYKISTAFKMSLFCNWTRVWYDWCGLKAAFEPRSGPEIRHLVLLKMVCGLLSTCGTSGQVTWLVQFRHVAYRFCFRSAGERVVMVIDTLHGQKYVDTIAHIYMPSPNCCQNVGSTELSTMILYAVALRFMIELRDLNLPLCTNQGPLR